MTDKTESKAARDESSRRDGAERNLRNSSLTWIIPTFLTFIYPLLLGLIMAFWDLPPVHVKFFGFTYWHLLNMATGVVFFTPFLVATFEIRAVVHQRSSVARCFHAILLIINILFSIAIIRIMYPFVAALWIE